MPQLHERDSDAKEIPGSFTCKKCGYTFGADYFATGICRPDVIDQHAPGAKLDQGKPDASLLLDFGMALMAVAEVGTFGKNKYTRGGWLKVEDAQNRYTAALLRHLAQESYESHDAESGLLHAAHAAWDALARLDLKLRQEGFKCLHK